MKGIKATIARKKEEPLGKKQPLGGKRGANGMHATTPPGAIRSQRNTEKKKWRRRIGVPAAAQPKEELPFSPLGGAKWKTGKSINSCWV